MTTLTPAQVIELLMMQGITEEEKDVILEQVDQWEREHQPLPENK